MARTPFSLVPTLSRSGTTFILDLGTGENRFTPPFLDELTLCLEQVQAAPPPRSLVTTAAGRFFSTGLDLDWIAEQPEQSRNLVQRFQDVLASILTCNAYTVAAVQGHAFAGGAMLALAHDVVLMRADRGFVCLPEVDLPVALTDGMTSLLLSKLSSRSAAEAVLTGRRYTADEAEHCGVVARSVAAGELLDAAIALAEQHASKDPDTLGTMKDRLYREAAGQLRHVGTDLPDSFPTYRAGSD